VLDQRAILNLERVWLQWTGLRTDANTNVVHPRPIKKQRLEGARVLLVARGMALGLLVRGHLCASVATCMAVNGDQPRYSPGKSAVVANVCARFGVCEVESREDTVNKLCRLFDIVVFLVVFADGIGRGVDATATDLQMITL